MPCGPGKESNSSEKNGENAHCAFEDLDHSILQHPFSLGVTNVKQILKCVREGSREVKDIILNECNIIYECKVCGNLFRSLANFLYHKRCYCKKHLCEEMMLFDSSKDEEEAVVVQPEPPAESMDNLQEEIDCSVEMIKADVQQDKNMQAGNSEAASGSKVTRSKGNKLKERLSVEEPQTPTKPVKTESSMMSRRTREKKSLSTNTRVLRRNAPEDSPPKKIKSTRRPSKDTQEKGTKSTAENEDSAEIEESQKPLNPSKENVSDKAKRKSTNASDDAKKKSTYASGETKKSLNTSIEEEIETELIEIDCEEDSESLNAESTKTPDELVKPVKKVIMASPRNVALNSSTVLGSLQKHFKQNRMELSSVTNSTEKSNKGFPKVVFESIDGNPHAVFQTTANKVGNAALKSKLDSSVPLNKPHSSRRVVMVKKNANRSVTAGPKVSSDRSSKTNNGQNEFHLTRRKRLLARSDCNVPELRCLTCKTQFTSLKTLYFHMLSIHSQKRLYYPCPFCKALFVQMYGVTRHLVTIHNKTKEQINKLRDAIKKKSIYKKWDEVKAMTEAPSVQVKSPTADLKEAKSIQKTPEVVSSNEGGQSQPVKTAVNTNKNATLHPCSKCGRVFGRKSSQVSHEKFCIMNAIKVDKVDTIVPMSPPPNISFLAPSSTKASSTVDQQIRRHIQGLEEYPSDIRSSARPKRGAEKQMHKDFVNSQTLKWRSANRIDTNTKAVKPSSYTKTIEKRVLNIMDTEKLCCRKCNKKFSSFSNLRRHVAIHVGWTRFKCRFCDFQAYNKSQCWNHLQKFHGVADENLDKGTVYIGSNMFKQMSKPEELTLSSDESSSESESSSTDSQTEQNIIPRQKTLINFTKSANKVQPPLMKKSTAGEKKDEGRKDKNQLSEVPDAKRQKLHTQEIKEVGDNRREKYFTSVGQKAAKVVKVQTYDAKDFNTPKKDKSLSEYRIDMSDSKKEKSANIAPIIKCTIADGKQDPSSYKTLTTSNPTTIILSKKSSSPTVQSLLTISPNRVSSTATKTLQLRTSPRKMDLKSSESHLVQSSVPQKNCTTVPIKLTVRRQSVEEIRRVAASSTEGVPLEKADGGEQDRLISKWFPKKDLTYRTAKRESSAPLIIGLVPATSAGMNARSKNPAVSYEKN